jgi:hypothetical protein
VGTDLEVTLLPVAEPTAGQLPTPADKVLIKDWNSTLNGPIETIAVDTFEGRLLITGVQINTLISAMSQINGGNTPTSSAALTPQQQTNLAAAWHV